MNYFIYIIPVAVILIVFVAGFAYSRKAAAKYQQGASASGQPSGTVEQPAPPQGQRGNIYEVAGVNQQSEHPLGAVQSVIRGRIRFVPTGLLFIAVGLFGLYILHLTEMDVYLERTTINMLVETVLSIGALAWGLQLISYATYRIKLRRTGFEIGSIFGTKGYEYKDADFYLSHTIEHKHDSDGYRPVFMKSGNYRSYLAMSDYLWGQPQADCIEKQPLRLAEK